MHYNYTMKHLKNCVILVLALAACEQNKKTSEPKPVQVSEVYQTIRDTLNNVDTPAIWHGPNDEHWLLATAKETNVILAYNAINGEQLHVFSESGTDIGQLDRPNSIAIVEDYAVVVERNNHRVQVFSLPQFKSIGYFGEAELIRPYGLSIIPEKDGAYRIFVTDNYETEDEEVPADSALGKRVQEFTFTINEGELSATFNKAFGATSGEGVLKKVESIMADPAQNRLLIADEDSIQNNIKVYDLEGNFTGDIMGEGTFKYEPEGIALYSCPENTGYWVTTDQGKKHNFFYVFDRKSLKHIGTFVNPNTLNTDGITISQRSFPEFPEGGFFPIHNDGNVSAVSWGEIAKALKLKVCS